MWRVARAPAPGGEAGVVFKRNPTPGTYDYGGVTLGGMLYVATEPQNRNNKKGAGGDCSLHCVHARTRAPRGLVMCSAKQTKSARPSLTLQDVPAVARYTSASLQQPRTMQKQNGKYWSLYGCYPSRKGYEAGRQLHSCNLA